MRYTKPCRLRLKAVVGRSEILNMEFTKSWEAEEARSHYSLVSRIKTRPASQSLVIHDCKAIAFITKDWKLTKTACVLQFSRSKDIHKKVHV